MFPSALRYVFFPPQPEIFPNKPKKGPGCHAHPGPFDFIGAKQLPQAAVSPAAEISVKSEKSGNVIFTAEPVAFTVIVMS